MKQFFSIYYHSRFVLMLSLASVVFLQFTGKISAHKVTAVSVVSKFDTKGRQFSVELAMDIYPSEDPAVNDQVSPQDAADFFANEALTLYFGDSEVEPRKKSEVFKDPTVDPEIEEQKVKVLVTLSGEIPKDAGHFTLRVSPDTTAAVVMVTFKDGKPGRRAEVLYPGEFSSPVNVEPVIEGDPFAGVAEGAAEVNKMADRATVVGEDRQEEQPGEKGAAAGSGAGEGSGDETDENRRVSGTMGHFVELGVRTFFSGYEAVLLALCFFFFSQKPRDMFFQVATFVVAFSLALGMAVFGLFSISGMSSVSGLLVGWGIPLGMVALAADNLLSKKLYWWRTTITALVGGLWGTLCSVTLGLAGISAVSVAEAFAGYNLGFQSGMLLTLAVAALAVMVFWKRDWYQKAVATPVSLLIAGLGLYWIVSRALGGG
jgi:hypothetical protein